ncbi:MAG: hypothetical protein ACT4QE_20780 [Anaerolineales bacterium]
MQDLLTFLTRYELWVYGILGTLAGLGLLVFWAAYQRADRALFGMERATAQGRQNLALGLSLGMLGVGLGIFVLLRYALLIINAPVLSPAVEQTVAAPTVVPTATAIQSGEPLVVDSSGCQDSSLTLTAPVSDENIASAAYEIRGTANTPKFAFYKIEISNAGTSGAWVTLAVGREPIVNGRLGSFSTEPYQPGEYAFRLAVVDNMGQMSAPCVIVVTLGAAPPTPAAP